MLARHRMSGTLSVHAKRCIVWERITEIQNYRMSAGEWGFVKRDGTGLDSNSRHLSEYVNQMNHLTSGIGNVFGNVPVCRCSQRTSLS